MSQKTIALIMAGGAGSRMALSRSRVPKALVEVGGYPLIVLSIYRLRAAGIMDIRISVHHGAQEIIHFLRRRTDLEPCELEFIVEEEPLGTIGALAELRDVGSDVLVQNGDLLSGIDLSTMLARHRQSSSDLTIATHLEHYRLKLGEVLTGSEGEVLAYAEKPVKQFKISSGTNVVSRACLQLCEPCVFMSFPEFVARVIGEGHKVIEFAHDAAWIDVNDEEDLQRAKAMFTQDSIAFGVHPHDLASPPKETG